MFFIIIKWGGLNYKDGSEIKSFETLEMAEDYMDTNMATSIAEMDFNNVKNVFSKRFNNRKYIIIGNFFSFWETCEIFSELEISSMIEDEILKK